AYSFFTKLHAGSFLALQHQLDNEIKLPVGEEAQPGAQFAACGGSGKKLLIPLESHGPQTDGYRAVLVPDFVADDCSHSEALAEGAAVTQESLIRWRKSVPGP